MIIINPWSWYDQSQDQIPYEKTPEEITKLILKEDKIWKYPYEKFNKKDIDELIKLVEEFSILSKNHKLRVIALTHFFRLVNEIYLLISNLEEDDEKIDLYITLIEVILKNKINRDVLEFSNLILPILKKYIPQYQHIKLKRLFDISVMYLNFDIAELCVRNMFFSQLDSSCLDNSIYLSSLFNYHGYYDQAMNILNIAKEALKVFIREDIENYREEIRCLNKSILENRTAAQIKLRQQALHSLFKPI
jgi:hypothetical protein